MAICKGRHFRVLLLFLVFFILTYWYLLLSFEPEGKEPHVISPPATASEDKKRPFDPESELKKLDMLIQVGQGSADLFYDRGWVYAYMGEMEKAKEEYTCAIEIDKEYIDAYYNRGLLYMRQKEYERGIEDFSQAIALDPEMVDAYCNRGNAYLHIGEIAQALEDYNAALRLYPQDPQLYYNRAIIYLAMGDKGKAMEDFEKAAGLGNEMARDYLEQAS